MQPGQVQCSRCGWQNEAGDRMCGGCGQPLYHSGSSFGATPDYTPTVASASAAAPPPLTPETRTATWAAPAYPQPQRMPPGTPTVAAPPSRVASPFPSAMNAKPRARSGTTGRSCLGRTLLSLVIATILLVVLAACGWAAFVRPALHTAVDQRLRAALAAEVDKIPAVPAGFPPITRTLTESAFNHTASASADQGGMKDVRLHFLPGGVTMTYRLWGNPGKITTQIVAINGRLFVQNTEVAGWLTQVENGGELQDTLNESLARLPAQDYVERVTLGDGTLTLTLRHA